MAEVATNLSDLVHTWQQVLAVNLDGFVVAAWLPGNVWWVPDTRVQYGAEVFTLLQVGPALLERTNQLPVWRTVRRVTDGDP